MLSNHQIHTGAFEALELQWKETIAGLQRFDPLAEVDVLVGSNILATYLRRQLAESGRSAANIRFRTFPDMVGYITGTSASTSDSPALSSLSPTVVLEYMLEDRANLPKAYVALSGHKGFRRVLLETFRDLRDAGVSAADLDRVCAVGLRSADRREQIENFASMYRRYRDEISRFHDENDGFCDAVVQLSKLSDGSDSSVRADSSPLLIYGIYDATGQQTQLLDALGRTRPMIYFIPFVHEDVSDFARAYLDSRASNLGVEPRYLVAPTKTGCLGKLTERNFGLSGKPIRYDALKTDDSIAMVSAPGESRAAVEVIREILRAVHDGVISGFHEAAVIMRSPETDAPMLSEAMRLRSIPHYIHGGEKFSNRPVCQAVMALIGLEKADFSRSSVLAAVEFIGAALSENRAGKWDVESWRAASRETELLTGVRAWDVVTRSILRRASRTVRRHEQSQETDLEGLTIARERFACARRIYRGWRIIRYAVVDWPAQASFTDWATLFKRRFGRILKTSSDWHFFVSATEEIAVLEALAQSGDRSKKYDTCSAVKIRYFLEEAVSKLTITAGWFQRGGVNLLSVSAARGLRFPLVIIPGLEQGRFPSRLKQDPLLPDTERRYLRSLPLRGARAEEERLLFDMTARSADKRLVLVTSRLDENADREKSPSQFFLRAASAVCGERITASGFNGKNIPGFRSVNLDTTVLGEGIVAVDESEIRLRWITSGRIPAAWALEYLAIKEPRRMRRALEHERSRRSNCHTRFDGLIADQLLLEWTRKKIDAGSGQVSASNFENYARCPYSFFLKRVLMLRVPEDERGILESMDPIDRGTVVHAALESFQKKHARENFDPANEESLRIDLETEARRVFEKNRPFGMPGLLWEIERDGMLTLVQNWLKYEIARSDGDMRVAGLEWAFGAFSDSPPFCSSVGEFNLEFCGRIDRVDVSGDGKRVRLVDYKIGKLPDTMRKKERSLLMGGEKIQLVIYRGALAEFPEFVGAESVEAEYLHLQPNDKNVRQCVITPEQMAVAFADLPRILKVLYASMKRGLFFARTYSIVYPGGHCENCDFQPICGNERDWLEKLKCDDPVIPDFWRDDNLQASPTESDFA